MIVKHLEECKEDWMFEEYHKQKEDRVPLPIPPVQFLADIESIQKFYNGKIQEKEKEKEKELPRSLSPIERKESLKIQEFKMVEGGLAE